MDVTEKWGDDVESAVNLALADLKLERDQVDITVLEEPSKGFFGIGSKLALVRVEKKKTSNEKAREKVEAPEKKAAEIKPAVKETIRPAKAEERKPAKTNDKPAQEMPRSRHDELDFHKDMDKLPVCESHPAMSFLKEVTEQMGLDLDMKLRRFKTGTPARALASTFDYDKMSRQDGDERIVPFSFLNDKLEKDQVPCWLTYTNEETHRIIRENFHRSALFGGQIEGIGPRYCPSIEDKVNRFADKKRHQLFVEPEGLDTEEMYIQGMSSSLPEDVQKDFYHTIAGLEKIKITRPAYAIEYDCINPLDLNLNLEYRFIKGLFCAGQFNGSSGYEEAASQGLIAGINAALEINDKKSLILDRSEAYIGVLIDDLVTKGTNEPYRIMTSRAEYRLVLRQDNADTRLTEKGYEVGLVSEERYQRYLSKKLSVEREMERLTSTFVKPKEVERFLEKYDSAQLQNKISLCELLKRPEITYRNMAEIDADRPELSEHAIDELEVQIKYEGYITKQMQQVARFKKLENKKLQEDMDYSQIEGLRIEAIQKLNQIKPLSVGQASRISGVSPADINVLLVQMEKLRRQKK